MSSSIFARSSKKSVIASVCPQCQKASKRSRNRKGETILLSRSARPPRLELERSLSF